MPNNLRNVQILTLKKLILRYRISGHRSLHPRDIFSFFCMKYVPEIRSRVKRGPRINKTSPPSRNQNRRLSCLRLIKLIISRLLFLYRADKAAALAAVIRFADYVTRFISHTHEALVISYV